MNDLREAFADRIFEEEGDREEAECVADKILDVTNEDAMKKAGVTKDDIEPIESLVSEQGVEVFYDECGS